MKRLLLTILFILALPAAMCQVPPVEPSPTVGGSASTGGASATGGAPTGGQSATGGVTGTTATTSVAARFPACNPANQKAAPIDTSKLKLGRKQSAIKRARKTSYEVDASAKSVFWPSLITEAIDQGDLGACTGFATVQARVNSPFLLSGSLGKSDVASLEELGRSLYHGATIRDAWEGVWPPDDTGSSGKAALETAIEMKLFARYAPIESLADMQRALQKGPLIFGVDWYDGMFRPSRCGEIKATGQVRGGHEITIVGLNVEDKTVWGLTSWGNKHGVCLDGHCGYFYMSYGMVSQLFAQNGEAEQPE